MEGRENAYSNDDQGTKRPPTDSDIVVGAGVVGAAAGLIVSGPLLALGVGAGVMGLAAAGNNKAGDVARSTGKVGVAAFKEGKKINERHHISEKVRAGLRSTVNKAKELDHEHKIVDKTKKGADKAWKSVRKFDEKHQVSSKTGSAISRGIEGISESLDSKNEQCSYGKVEGSGER